MPVDALSIHAPARGATRHNFCIKSSPSSFNPRAREGRDRDRRGCGIYHGPFNPRAREGRDTRRSLRTIELPLSIHAPARGATACARRNGRPYGLSIHAPARGATRSCVLHRALQRLSIHAPARGATRVGVCIFGDGTFQSTRPRGARLPACMRTSSSCAFQSTRPRGARPYTDADTSLPQPFNPRAREGRDACHKIIRATLALSIHAPARGATGIKDITPRL